MIRISPPPARPTTAARATTTISTARPSSIRSGASINSPPSDGTQRRTHYDGARMTSWDEEGQRTEADLDSLGRTVERRTYDGETLAVTMRQHVRWPRPRPRHCAERRDPADVHLRLARAEDADGRCRLRHLALRIRRRRQPALAGRSARRPARRVLLRRHRPAHAASVRSPTTSSSCSRAPPPARRPRR